jgi:4-hydroxybenzoate polyprenyltransferase
VAALLLLARRAMQLNVLLAAGAASLAITAAFASGGTPAFSGVVAVFASVFSVYNFDRIADRSPAEGRSTPERRATTERWRPLLRISIVASTFVALALGAMVSAAAFAWTIAFPLLGFAYVLPIRLWGRVLRLKDVPYLKPFYVCACWVELFAVSLSHSDLGPTSAVLVLGVFVYARLFISANLADVRDADDDAAAGIRSLPQRLGRRGMLRLLDTLHWASVGGLVIAVASGVAPITMLALLVPTAVGYAIFRVFVRRPDRHELLLELYDLEIVLYAPVWALASAFVAA